MTLRSFGAMDYVLSLLHHEAQSRRWGQLLDTIVLKETLHERFGLHSQPHMINARHWHKAVTSKQQVTTVKSAHMVFIG